MSRRISSSKLYRTSASFSDRSPEFSVLRTINMATALSDAARVLGLAREPAAKPVVRLQIADLSLVGHRVLQHADEAHGYGWERLIPRLVELPCKVLSG